MELGLTGRPLHRKVIKISNPTISSSSQVTADTISNVSEIIKVNGMLRGSSGFTVPVGSIWSNDLNNRNSIVWADISSNTATIKYTINSGWTSVVNLTIILEYTKTTD